MAVLLKENAFCVDDFSFHYGKRAHWSILVKEMSECENSARPISDFIYTKNSARPGFDFIYTKNFALSGSDFIYTNRIYRKFFLRAARGL